MNYLVNRYSEAFFLYQTLSRLGSIYQQVPVQCFLFQVFFFHMEADFHLGSATHCCSQLKLHSRAADHNSHFQTALHLWNTYNAEDNCNYPWLWDNLCRNIEYHSEHLEMDDIYILHYFPQLGYY